MWDEKISKSDIVSLYKNEKPNCLSNFKSKKIGFEVQSNRRFPFRE